MQIIAATVWNGRIAPVFETASQFLVAETQGEEILRLLEIDVEDASVPARIRQLADTQANVLICGAICDMYAAMIEAHGITIVPFLSGPAQDVVQACVSGRRGLTGYDMPGCRRRNRNRFRSAATKETAVRTQGMPNQDGTGSAGKDAGRGRNGGGRASGGRASGGRRQGRNAGACRGGGRRGKGGSRRGGGQGPAA